MMNGIAASLMASHSTGSFSSPIPPVSSTLAIPSIEYGLNPPCPIKEYSP